MKRDYWIHSISNKAKVIGLSHDYATTMYIDLTNGVDVLTTVAQ